MPKRKTEWKPERKRYVSKAYRKFEAAYYRKFGRQLFSNSFHEMSNRWGFARRFLAKVNNTPLPPLPPPPYPNIPEKPDYDPRIKHWHAPAAWQLTAEELAAEQKRKDEMNERAGFLLNAAFSEDGKGD